MLSMGQGLLCGMLGGMVVLRPDLLDGCMSTPQRTKRGRGKKETATNGWPCSSVFLSSVVRDVIHDSYVSDGNSSPFESNNFFFRLCVTGHCVRPSRGAKAFAPPTTLVRLASCCLLLLALHYHHHSQHDDRICPFGSFPFGWQDL